MKRAGCDSIHANSHLLISSLLYLIIIIICIIPCVDSNSNRQLETPRFLTKKSCRFEGDGCQCVSRGERGECCCRGRDVKVLPRNLTSSLRVLVMYNTSLEQISSNFFDNYTTLEEIEIFSSPELHYVDGTALDILSNLKKFSLTWCKKLHEISGTLMEKNLRIQTVILRDNALKRMPGLRMTDDHRLEVEVDLSGNQIQYIGERRVHGVRARSLRLNHNRIREIAAFAFKTCSFAKLYLNNNPELNDLSVDSFKGISELHHLQLSDTIISELPKNGLENLKSLTLTNVPTLKSLPSVLSFPKLKTAHFTYPHHCCLFKHVDSVLQTDGSKVKSNKNRLCKEQENRLEKVKRRKKREATSPPFEFADWFPYFTDSWLPEGEQDAEEELPEFPPNMIGALKCLSETQDTTAQKLFKNITCTPQPDALNPCENIVGYPLLRKTIWIVWVLAIVGNILVWLSLSLAFEHRMRIHYLLMINLSIADLLTGVYLGILAIQDVRTSNEYYRHAVEWQTGWGCRTAGFLAVFASKLSIISMFLIAFEIVYNTRMGFYGRRLSLKVTLCLLGIGWIYSIVMAAVPLLGISSYSTTSICLPLKVDNIVDKVYLISGLSFNLIAFMAMVGCYVVIIILLKDPSTPSRDEDKAIIAKMALLIFTDLVCWFPTIFFGMTAALGYPLISISNAKVFLVFFFPLNSFANPFLYVFLTEVIRRKVRSKTMPVLKRITSTPGIALNTLSNFYNSQPPGRRDEPCSPTRLQVTQMTSLNSTPRGSKCSTTKTIDSMDTIEIPPKRNSSSPRVSFQEDTISGHRASSESMKRFIALQKRVSAIPEVSDLSEHSSESHHEHIPRQVKEESERPPRPSWQRLLRRNRHESAKSSGQDSGRGSITSTGTERTSLASANADFDTETTVFLPKRLSLDASLPSFQLRNIRKLSPLSSSERKRKSSAADPSFLTNPMVASVEVVEVPEPKKINVSRFFGYGKKIPKDVKRHCGICRQHGIVVETKKHMCQFKDCDCAKCKLVRKRRSIMSTQIRLRREQDKKFQRTTDESEADIIPLNGEKKPTKEEINLCYFCQKCKNHGVLMWKKDHKKNCKFADCRCAQCDLIDTRRALDRHIKKNKLSSAASETSSSEVSSVSSPVMPEIMLGASPNAIVDPKLLLASPAIEEVTRSYLSPNQVPSPSSFNLIALAQDPSAEFSSNPNYHGLCATGIPLVVSQFFTQLYPYPSNISTSFPFYTSTPMISHQQNSPIIQSVPMFDINSMLASLVNMKQI
ncbi:unnamed protein product [Auanema sp. JU1783]|nr:unnamed protein product [Auanema sp. JU1783]